VQSDGFDAEQSIGICAVDNRYVSIVLASFFSLSKPNWPPDKRKRMLKF